MSSDRLQQLLAFYETNPEDSFICFALAKEYEGQGEREKALELYQKLVAESPEYIGTYYHLGKLLEALEQPAAAFQVYKDGMAMAQKSGDQHAFSELAAAKLDLGDDDDFE
ncbi:MAG: tetratricopeptide repeat protein [Saprospiraceae bacterium]